jgi:hypothetical protein
LHAVRWFAAPFLRGVQTISAFLPGVCAVGFHLHFFARRALVCIMGCDCKAKQTKFVGVDSLDEQGTVTEIGPPLHESARGMQRINP